MADDNYDEYSGDESQFNTTANLSTHELRTLAQSHLDEIERDINTETQQQAKAQSEIQKYIKSRRKVKTKEPSRGSSSPSSLLPAAETQPQMLPLTKGPKLRSAQDVLDRLRWDESVKLSEYMVGYLERFEGIKEMPVSNWVRESTDEEFIPQHRIRYVKRRSENGGEEVVWDRDGRIDKIFGSGRIVGDGEEAGDVEGSEGGVRLP